MTLHLIGNAHLDPVWSWDWREGLNEGIATCRAVLDLMDEEPELTFVRGESAVYEHVERHDPPTFARIRARVTEGRWDPVGGMVVQPDTNLPSTETLLASLALGQAYFSSRFGRPARVAWLPDSFGHTAGLPEILAAAGITGFAFTRSGAGAPPFATPAFWWEGAAGARILAYRPPAGWYGCERDSIPGLLDAALAAASGTDLETVGVFYGLGNHGGGPSRRHVCDIRAWAAAHPGVTVRFSTLHGLFDALAAEAGRRGPDFLPSYRGELGPCFRGCYSSLARFKALFRRTEALVRGAERTAGAIGCAIGGAAAADALREAWAALALNAFHDILTGTMIERAADDQAAWLGGAWHRAQGVRNDALLALARGIDTAVQPAGGDAPAPVPVLLWNPNPFDVEGPVEVEAALDARPLLAYRGRSADLPVELLDGDGTPLPAQVIASEGLALSDFPWRKRVVTRLRVPALGWRLVTLGTREGARTPRTPSPSRAPSAGAIENGRLRVSARRGARGVQVSLGGMAVLGGRGLHAVTLADPYGSWGDMNERPGFVPPDDMTADWRVTGVKVLEPGPERALLWVRMEGGGSRLDLRIGLARGRRVVDVEARVLWNERSALLKLVMPCGARDAEFEVPGGTLRRGSAGEVPGGRWVRVRRAPGKGGTGLGFASDALYGFDLRGGALRVSVVRASRWCCDRVVGPGDEPWTPPADSGELRFRFLLAPGGDAVPELARVLEEPVIAVPVPPTGGSLPRTGSLLRVQPGDARILAFRPARDGDGLVLSLQAVRPGSRPAAVEIVGCRIELGTITGGRIHSWRIARGGGRWTAREASALD